MIKKTINKTTVEQEFFYLYSFWFSTLVAGLVDSGTTGGLKTNHLIFQFFSSSVFLLKASDLMNTIFPRIKAYFAGCPFRLPASVIFGMWLGTMGLGIYHVYKQGETIEHSIKELQQMCVRNQQWLDAYQKERKKD